VYPVVGHPLGANKQSRSTDTRVDSRPGNGSRVDMNQHTAGEIPPRQLLDLPPPECLHRRGNRRSRMFRLVNHCIARTIARRSADV
jgi:hypothetical protein